MIVLSCNKAIGREYSDMTNNIYLFKEENVKEFLEGRNSASEPVTLVFTDTCIQDKSFLRSDLWKMLFLNHRQYALDLIIELQYCVNMKPELRCNVDRVWAARENTLACKRKLKEYFEVEPVDERYVFTNREGESIKAPFLSPSPPPFKHISYPFVGVRFVYAS